MLVVLELKRKAGKNEYVITKSPKTTKNYFTKSVNVLVILMKLFAELVPSTVWYSSLYRLLPSEVWNTLRDDIISKNGRRCQVCGETWGKMNLHERWSYDDKNFIQKLEGFILLCTMCHHVKHIGLAGILADHGKLDYNDVIAHFCKVNACAMIDFTNHVDEAFATWNKRSQHQWRQEFGEYSIYLKKQ